MAVTGNPPRVVVYGGIGSGKSTFTAALAALGAVVIDADSIGHEVIRSDGPAFAAVAARWPGVLASGEVDRSALGAEVFAEPAELAELEAITHPHIAAEIMRRTEAAGDRPVVVEVPLLAPFLGDGWIWVLVDAPEELRLERTVDRGLDAADARARMASQPNDQEWHAVADWIVVNTGSVSDLEKAAAELWEHLDSP